MASDSFSNKKALELSFYVAANGVTRTISGLRISAEIDKAGGMMMGTGKFKIHGLPRALMDEMTTLQWRPRTLLMNTVKLTAIDGDVRTVVFEGNVISAWGDYQTMPDVFFHIQAQNSMYAQTKTPSPRSYTGPVDVAQVMGLIAKDAELTLENSGVDIKLGNVYLTGSPIDQIRSLAKAAGIDFYIDGGILAICPASQGRTTTTIPLVSKSTGMVGYPVFNGYGVAVQMLFNPAISHGGRFKLETDVSPAAGEWIAASISLRLESEKPGGAWFQTVIGNQIGLAITK